MNAVRTKIHNGQRHLGLLLCIMAAMVPLRAQDSNERTFSQTKLVVEKALKGLQPTSGRLPTLEGFVQEGNRNLDQFQRGYYECSVAVAPSASGGSMVRVTAKITAWHQGTIPAKSGYETLPSNGRLESDLLDRLAGALQGPSNASGSAKAAPPLERVPSPSSPSVYAHSSEPTLAAPMPQLPALNSPLTGSTISAPAKSNHNEEAPSQRASDQRLESLLSEEKNLEEVLRDQSHPTNLVAVKEHGAPVLASPTEGAKVLFTAAPEDEFEVLDENVSWVHVRIVGISRGWIARSNLEMPEDAGPSDATASPSELFHVTNEQIVQFPGDWDPLRGKTVKIVSVQATSDAVVGWRAKREYAKTVFLKDYATLAASGGESGEVLIYDAQDGGMIAATLDSVKKWRDKAISDEDFWKGCYFDPPETFGVQASQ
jgi:hypothetical protein